MLRDNTNFWERFNKLRPGKNTEIKFQKNIFQDTDSEEDEYNDKEEEILSDPKERVQYNNET